MEKKIDILTTATSLTTLNTLTDQKKIKEIYRIYIVFKILTHLNLGVKRMVKFKQPPTLTIV